ncbi:MAG: hypothetical protein ACI4EJ_08785, partial [Bacteroides sp.]
GLSYCSVINVLLPVTPAIICLKGFSYLLSRATAILEYHQKFIVSTSFLIFFVKFLKSVFDHKMLCFF